MFKISSALVLATLALTQSTSPVVVRDLDGGASSPLSPKAGQVNVLFFLSHDCPISARYSPEIDRIVADYAKKNVRAWLVYAEPSLTPDAARANIQQFHPKTTATIVIDSDFALTKAVDATVTPEVAIYTSQGRVYRGRIDDWYQTLGQARREPTRRDLRDALDAALAGKPVTTPVTTPIGCFIERK